MVVSVNLFPWREQQHLYQQKQVKMMLAITMVLSIFLMVLLHFVIGMLISNVDKKIYQLEKNLEHHKSIIKNFSVTPKLTIMRKPWHEDVRAKKLLENLGRTLITETCFSAIKSQGEHFFFAGLTRNADALSKLINTLAENSELDHINIKKFEYDAKSRLIKFQLTAKRISTNAP